MSDSPYMLESVCTARGKMLDERFARDRTAIEELERNIATLSKLVTELATLQKTNAQTQAEHEKRIRALELQPAGKWDKLQNTVVTAIASGLVGYMLSNLIEK